MYDTAKKARAANKAKAERLANRPLERVDSSDWTPPPLLNAEVKTGMRPVSKQALKRGGKVHGTASKARADRVARKAGGRVETKGEQPLVDRYVNRDLKKANEYRDGDKHEGALKRGGRAKKYGGGGTQSEENPAKKGLRLQPSYSAKNVSDIMGADADDGFKMPKNVPLPPERKENYKSDYDLNTQSYKKGGAAKEKWIQKAIKKPGALHKQLGVAEGKKIPAKKLEAAAEKGGKLGKRARLAKTLRAMHAEGGKVHSDVAEDKKLVKSMVKPAALKDKACYGGRMKKADGGGADPRLSMVSPKALTFGQNVVTPGLKKGGRIKKEIGGAAIGAGAPAVAALAPVTVNRVPPAEMVTPPVSSGLVSQPGYMGSPPPAYDPSKYDASKTGSGLGFGDGKDRWKHGFGSGDSAVPPVVPPPNAEADSGSGKWHDRTDRARGGRTKGKGKTNINIVIAQAPKHPADQMQAGMPPAAAPPKGTPVPVPPVGAGAMPMGGAMPPMAGGMPPMGAGMGAPPAMGARPMPFKKGGRVEKQIGGALGIIGSPNQGNFGRPRLMGPPVMARKAGGRISKVAHSYKDMEAGAGSGEGRLQKTDIAERMPKKAGGQVGHRSYRSYKDMDAGAGSGFGRLEKTAIESKKSRKG